MTTKKPRRAEVWRAVKKLLGFESQVHYEALILALWRQPHREEKCFALMVARAGTKFVDISSMLRPLPRRYLSV